MSNIKTHPIYPIYLEYLHQRRMNKGEIEFAKISETLFYDFKFRYDTDKKFKKNQDAKFISKVREEKIDEIIHDKSNKPSKS